MVEFEFEENTYIITTQILYDGAPYIYKVVEKLTARDGSFRRNSILVTDPEEKRRVLEAYEQEKAE